MSQSEPKQDNSLSELEVAEERLQKAIAENHRLANEYAKAAPEEFFLRVCHGCSDYPLPQDQSIFVGPITSHTSYFRDFANLYIEKFRLPLIDRNDSWQSIRDLIKKSWHIKRPSFIRPFPSGSGDVILDSIMRQVRDEADFAGFHVCYYVLKGVPVYQIDPETRNPIRQLEDNEPMPTYLRMKALNNENFELFGTFPTWFDTYGFKVAHLRENDAIFDRVHEENYEQLEQFVPLFRQRIGVAENPTPIEPEVSHTKTTLLGFAEAVQRRYYGSNFNLNDRSTWTSSETIVAWLQTQGLSHREASAVDLVTRPDLLRKGK